MNPSYKFIVTAEHASPDIPANLELALRSFASSRQVHQVYDPGTKAIAEEMARKLDCPSIFGEFSRLAIDLNRSIGNPSQFSPIVQELGESEKAGLITDLFIPFREGTIRLIEKFLREGCVVIHLSIHSFSKIFDGARRETDIGILFDDQRSTEVAFSQKLIKLLRIVLPDLKVHANSPYHGREDGHTTALRKRYPEGSYIGLEIEFSQDLALDLDAESYATIVSKALKAVARSGRSTTDEQSHPK